MARGKRRRQVSLRLDDTTLTTLDRLAQETGASRNTLAERYIAEGAQMDEFAHIYFRDGALGRRAAILGTRLDVWQVMETVRNHGNSIEKAALYLEEPVERVEAAVRYYAANQGEVDEFAARAKSAADRAEGIWRAQQQLLATEA